MGDHRYRLLELLGVAFVLLVGGGFFYAQRFEDFVGCSVLLGAAMAPAALWIRSNGGGIPIWPTCAGLYWLYFGLPTLHGEGEEAGYSAAHVLDADLTITLFLLVTTIVWSQFLRPPQFPKRAERLNRAMDRRAAVFVAMIGLVMGLSYYAVLYSSLADLLGNANGVVRAVLLAPLYLACYLLGYGKAKGIFSQPQWIVALAALVAILVLQAGGLQLITGATEIGAVLAGYIYTARKIPWIPTLLVAAAIAVFQAGKAEIRDQYRDIDITAAVTPSLVTKWFTAGFDTISNGAHYRSVSDRVSLLPQMIRVQLWTPSRVPYLDGETYTYLPGMLVPRIFNPNRAPTQIVMNLLDVRYGFLRPDEVHQTAVGVNIVPEAFANFGYTGVIGLAIFFGIFIGYFTRQSIGKDATSLPTLLAISTLVAVIDLEADLSYFLTTIFQTFVAVTVFYYGLRFVFDTRHEPVEVKEPYRGQLMKHADPRSHP